MLLGIDLLRILAANAVIAIHYSGPFVTNSALMEENLDLWRIFALIDVVSRFSVPVFVVLTGFGFQAIVESFNYRDLVRKKLIFIFKLTAFSTLLFLGYRVFLGDFGYEPSQILKGTLKAIIAGKPYFHLWYFYMAIGLVCVGVIASPILNRVKELRHRVKIIIWAFLICQLFSIQDFYYGNKNLFIFWWIEYIGYFIFGFYLNSFRLNISRTLFLFLFIASSICVLLLYEASVTAFGFRRGAFPLDFVSPFVVLQVFAIVIVVASLKQHSHRAVRYLAEITPFVYIIHPFVTEYFTGFTTLPDRVSTVFLHFSLSVGLSWILGWSLCHVFKWRSK